MEKRWRLQSIARMPSEDYSMGCDEMYLLKKDNFEFEDILSNGYSNEEEVPVVVSEITTASGFIRRSYAQNTATTITLNLFHLEESTLKAYLDQLDCVEGNFSFWSPKHQKYRKGSFLVEHSGLTLVSSLPSGDMDKRIYDDYSITLRQNGVITDV